MFLSDHEVLVFSAILFFFLLPLQISASPSKAAASMQKKLQYVESNGAAPRPNEKPTQFTEEEINSYLASDLVILPLGIESARFSGSSGQLTATARINFDQIKTGRRSSNPLLFVFSGTHDVLVSAHAHGEKHQGYVHVDTVQLDGVEIPEFVLQLFVEKYLQPKYPNIGIDSQFPLPDKIDTASIGNHVLTITQR